MPDPDPRQALDSIREARASMGRNLSYPVAWDLLYGLICAVLVGGQGLPDPFNTLTLALALTATVLAVQWWRKRLGWWVNGYNPPRARWVAFGLALVLGGLMVGTLANRWAEGPWWVPLASGAGAFVIAIAGGRLWMRVYRRDLEAGL